MPQQTRITYTDTLSGKTEADVETQQQPPAKPQPDTRPKPSTMGDKKLIAIKALGP